MHVPLGTSQGVVMHHGWEDNTIAKAAKQTNKPISYHCFVLAERELCQLSGSG